MIEEMIVSRQDQAVALQDAGFLGQFIEPASPTDVARTLRIPANLAHHHAKKHTELGLLEQVGRDAGKVYYQLAARVFKHHRSLIPVGHPDERVTTTLDRLARQFLQAYERSDRLAGNEDPDWTVYSFHRERRPDREVGIEGITAEPHPAHIQVRTLRLSAQRYQALVRQVWQLLDEAKADESDARSACTLAFLAMDGALLAGEQDGQTISSFVPPPGTI